MTPFPNCFSTGCPGVTSKSTGLGVQENQEFSEFLVPILACSWTWPQHIASLSLPFLLVKWSHLVIFTCLLHSELWI